MGLVAVMAVKPEKRSEGQTEEKTHRKSQNHLTVLQLCKNSEEAIHETQAMFFCFFFLLVQRISSYDLFIIGLVTRK